MRIYLDNCCFNRPFDDQAQIRVRLEAEAKLCIQENIRDGTIELAWSYILDFENEKNPFEDRRTVITGWKRYAIIDIVATSSLHQKADALVALGLKDKDALHLVCAMAGGCGYFLTTDDEILKRAKDIQGIIVSDPISFICEMNL